MRTCQNTGTPKMDVFFFWPKEAVVFKGKLKGTPPNVWGSPYFGS